ncbi:MAG: cyanophycin synthetase [Hyphomonadaceae bacterium]|nr:cyanophycin synthetase [Hyphomonadaceae bacterium]
MTISAYPKFGAGDQTLRVRGAAALAGVDLDAFAARSCVITGSNGKGSTAAILQAALMRRMPRVGLFTSPHLLSIRERFRIDHDDIGAADFARCGARADAAARSYERAHPGCAFGAFEMLFLTASLWFQERACSFVVWEAGIGGRHDVTRLVNAPLAAVVSLDLEHTALLGNTLEAIALDKMDVVAPGGCVVFGKSCQPRRGAIEAHAQARGVSTLFADPAQPPAGLAGAHQRENAGVALALAARIHAGLGPADIADAAVRWPGRLETLGADPLLVIDVGHTPAAIAAALDGFASLAAGRPAVLITGCSIDKNAAAMLDRLAPAFDRIIAAQAPHKGRPAAEIAAAAQVRNPRAHVEISADIADALRRARDTAGAGGAVYVAGGLFLAASVKAAHLGLDPAGLAFF